MAIKLQIESISLKLKEHIMTLRGKKVSELINKTLKVKKLKYPLNVWLKPFTLKSLQKRIENCTKQAEKPSYEVSLQWREYQEDEEDTYSLVGRWIKLQI